MTNEEIQAIYLQECEEGLGHAEAALLDIKSGQYDAETINSIFRAVHSIKGGAGAFGFADLQSFTHHFETLLDKVRDGDVAMLDMLQQAAIPAQNPAPNAPTVLAETAASDLGLGIGLDMDLGFDRPKCMSWPNMSRWMPTPKTPMPMPPMRAKTLGRM